MEPEERAWRLVQRLRDEAAGLRDCFTQFSFKALAFSSAALGLIFAASEKYPSADLAAIPILALLITVARIGVYKYSSSNRLLGYQVHLERTKSGEEGTYEPRSMVDWEIALRAWRVVQPAIFRTIYRTPEEYPRGTLGRIIRSVPGLRWLNDKLPFYYRLRSSIRRNIEKFKRGGSEDGYPWFMLHVITLPTGNGKDVESDKEAEISSPYYHSGSYLKHMLKILILMQVLIIVPIFLSFRRTPYVSNPRLWLVVLLLGIIILSGINVDRRRKIIESELLSIHGCAITWDAVVTAHHRAKDRSKNYRHYTENLVEEAQKLAEHVLGVHEWVQSDGQASIRKANPHTT